MTNDKNDKTLRSMTGFASCEGSFEDWTWSLELRSVNGKGLDLRLRLPDWIEGLEAQMRTALGKVVKRGSVTLSLRLARAESAGSLVLNMQGLDAVLSVLNEITHAASAAGLTLRATSAAEIAQMKGVMETGTEAKAETAPLAQAILKDLRSVLTAFDAMRAQEGTALASVLDGQLTEVAQLTGRAAELAEARKDHVAATLKRNLARVLDQASEADPDRVAQELALLAVKSDVTEEIDRLGAHVNAARALLAEGSHVGRKLDFLMQEFNREANTLCSKSQSTELTQTGLALKALIDQMREQVQNVE